MIVRDTGETIWMGCGVELGVDSIFNHFQAVVDPIRLLLDQSVGAVEHTLGNG